MRRRHFLWPEALWEGRSARASQGGLRNADGEARGVDADPRRREAADAPRSLHHRSSCASHAGVGQPPVSPVAVTRRAERRVCVRQTPCRRSGRCNGSVKRIAAGEATSRPRLLLLRPCRCRRRGLRWRRHGGRIGSKGVGNGHCTESSVFSRKRLARASKTAQSTLRKETIANSRSWMSVGALLSSSEDCSGWVWWLLPCCLRALRGS